MKAYRDISALLPVILNPALHWRNWSKFGLAALALRNNTGTCWTGGWESPRASLDVSEKRQISFLCQAPDRPAPSIGTVPNTLSRLLISSVIGVKNKWIYTSIFITNQVRNRKDSERTVVAIIDLTRCVGAPVWVCIGTSAHPDCRA
jgi:hypothetical protein